MVLLVQRHKLTENGTYLQSVEHLLDCRKVLRISGAGGFFGNGDMFGIDVVPWGDLSNHASSFIFFIEQKAQRVQRPPWRDSPLGTDADDRLNRTREAFDLDALDRP